MGFTEICGSLNFCGVNTAAFLIDGGVNLSKDGIETGFNGESETVH